MKLKEVLFLSFSLMAIAPVAQAQSAPQTADPQANR